MKKYLFPTATLAVLALAAPSVAAATSPESAKPATSNTPACDAFAFTVDPLPETGGTYTVTAQHYDSETITPVGDEVVFTGELSHDNLVTLDAAATDYLLWTYRFEFPNAPKLDVVYGERQLDCRIVEEPVDPEEPGEDIPLIPLEPATPVEEETDVEDVPLTPLTPAEPIEPEPSTPEPVEPEATATPEPKHAVTPRVGTAISTEAAAPVVAEPRTAG